MRKRSASNSERMFAGGNRRKFCQLAAGCAGLSWACSADYPTREAAAKVLTETDRIDVGTSAQAIIEKAYELGRTYESKYEGCAQCTVAALQDCGELFPKSDDVFVAASCLDGGATPTKYANCGSFTGAGMVIGHLCGRTRENFDGKARLAHELIHQLHDEYEKAYGGVLCKVVREKANADCPEVVGKAAKWTAEILLRQFTDYE